MGREHNKRAVGSGAGLAVPVNAITLSDVAQTLAVGGVNIVTYGTSGNSNDLLLPAPNLGDVVRIAVYNDTTSVEANINTAASGSVFFGTTSNTITIGATAALNASMELVGMSTTQWATTSLSSTGHFTFSATTGSTGQ